MKRLITTLGVLVLVGALAVPVMAWHRGWGGGHHMMRDWDSGSEYDRDYGNSTSEERGKLDALDRKFYDETSDIRNQIRIKSRELDSILNNSNPDLEEAKGLQKEISELRARMDERTLNYELEARKINPNDRLGSAYGGRHGRHMRGYGRGMGQGYCWN